MRWCGWEALKEEWHLRLPKCKDINPSGDGKAWVGEGLLFTATEFDTLEVIC